MHTWALFSCSSLITLTAYNLTHLPKTDKPAPEPEPDNSDQVSESAKFSMDTMRGQFPEFEQIARPSLPDQPQLARKIEEPPGYNPALYDPAQYPVREVDLVGGIAAGGTSGRMTYRVDAIAPLPTLVPPPPSVNPFPLAANPAATTTRAPRSRSIAQPRPEPAAVAPSFAPRPAPASVAPTPPPTSPPKAVPTAPAPAAEGFATDEPPELFAALPDGIEIAPPTELPEPPATRPAPTPMAMTDVVTFDPLAEMTAPEVTAASANTAPALTDLPAAPPAPIAEPADTPVAVAAEPVAAPPPPASMALAPTRHDLIDRYCDRPLAETNAATRDAVCDAGTSE